MKAVLVKVPLKLIASIIGLPPTIKITRARQTWEDELAGGCELLLESEEFDVVPEGSPIPEAYITVNVNDRGKATAHVDKYTK